MATRAKDRGSSMIDLYYWPTPNGHKVTLMLEETGTPYTLKPVNIGAGAQFEKSFLAIAPNNKMPAIVDHEPVGGGAPFALFESGAILEYLADKTGQFLPKEGRARYEVLQWLYWQMAGLGPMAGQNHHFNRYAPEDIPYAKTRYINETNRLYGVLNQRLGDSAFVGGAAYSIADMAIFPWTKLWEHQSQNIEDFPHIKRWMDDVDARPGTQRAYARGPDVNPEQKTLMTEEAEKILFGQTAKSLDKKD